ncbi:PKD domain-containing protein [Sanyastnella coralliicola]|uniref:DUF7948 domain-containing protein n=1 Tax=Sanyastnella coralliicola TaxID=3069118 RepID=UPI0027B949F3|nr:PKD domain-containing protein [Longitalea sp. SCSIO 12813]
MKRFALLLILASISVSLFAHNGRKAFNFRENLGQWHDNVKYRVAMGNATLFLEENAMTWNIVHPEDYDLIHESSEWSRQELLAWQLRGHAYKVIFENGNTQNIVGQEQESTYYNYFLGNDQSKWASNVHGFNAVRYSQIWDGVGMRIYNSADQLKYDFIVNANAETDQVVLRYEGLEGMSIVDGVLYLETSVGQITELAPYAYQMNGNSMEEVACEYVLSGDKISFSFPDGYDTSRQLIIDPIVIASTLSGTTGDSNYGHSAAYDIAGNIYTGARAFGAGYPTTTGAYQEDFAGAGFAVDMAMSKLNPTGTDLLWASYLGGTDTDYPHSLIANDFEELYVYGSTSSNDFPVSDDAYQPDYGGGTDIVVSHFSADGTELIGSTYMGGSDQDGVNSASVNYGDTFRGEIVLNGDQIPYVASFSTSTDFPTTGGVYQPANAGEQDAVIFTMNEELSSLTWSTYLGGTAADTGYGLRVTVDGNVFVAGQAGSDDFPTTAGAYETTFQGGGGGGWGPEKDGFLARLSANGADLQACTFYGTTEEDQAFFVDLNNDEEPFIYGQSQGDIPVTADVYSEEDGSLFIAKFNYALTELLAASRMAVSTWGGYAGVPVAFLVDRCDNIYISAYSAGGDLSLTDDAVYDTGGFYLAAYGEDISTLEFASYYGANHVDGGTSRFDKNGIIYQGVCSGGGFPTNADAYATDQSIGWDIGVFKMDFQVSGVNAAITASADALNGCAPHTIEFNNYSVGNIYTWDFGDGSPLNNEFEPEHTYTEPGVYEVSLISLDSLSCNLADTAYLEISISEPTDFLAAFEVQLDCEDLGIVTDNQTGIEWLEYQWDMGDGTILEGFNVEHFYVEEGDYTITLNAVDNGCDADDEASQDVQIVGSVLASTDASSYEGCGELTIDFANTSNGLTYEWDFGDGSPTTTDENPSHTFQPGEYTVTLTAFHPESCNLEDDTTLTVVVGPDQVIDAAFQLLQTDCESFLVEGTDQSTGEFLAFEWDMDDGTTYDTPDISHNYGAMGEYQVSLTITDTLCDASDTEILNITVLDEVTAIIGNDDLEGCHPYVALFENNSAGTNFYWDFGDGSPVIDSQVAEHEYAEPGVYTVTLTVEGVGNCGGTDVTEAIVTVVETPEIEALFEMEQTGACEAMTVDFDNLSTGDGLEYDWSVDGTTYSVAEMEHIFSGPGTYDIVLNISEPVCDATDSFSQTIEVLDGIDLIAPDDVYMCYYEFTKDIAITGPAEATYEWNTGETEQAITITEPGIYTITATLNNCTDSEGLEVIGVEKLILLDNPTACEGIQTMLEIPYDDGTNYQWCDGSELDYIYASEPGEYCYQFTDIFGCQQEGLVILDQVDQDGTIYIPNAFTPNNDGINDIFKAEGVDIRSFELTVWNRWGEEVYRSESIDQFWDGSNQGSEYYVQDGVYTWRVEYNSTCSSEKVLETGTVLIMR